MAKVVLDISEIKQACVDYAYRKKIIVGPAKAKALITAVGFGTEYILTMELEQAPEGK